MKKNNHSALYFGTSNMVVPGNKHSFPEKFRSGTWSYYYITLFNTSELNSMFYKIAHGTHFRKVGKRGVARIYIYFKVV